jgi:hypothetical protein
MTQKSFSYRKKSMIGYDNFLKYRNWDWRNNYVSQENREDDKFTRNRVRENSAGSL